jgi:pilus assembly protein FimV
VTLADREIFERSGLERPAFMSDLRFDVARGSNGRNVISVTSATSVAEPFVTMIIEASWTGGLLNREYTVFLDPPVLLNAPQSAAPVAVPQTGSAQAGQGAAPIRRQPTQPAAPQAAPQRPASAAPAAAPNRSADSADTYGPVQRAETLWSIAERYRPNGATMNQTMLSIYEANQQAFGGNINSLRVGAILRIPAGSQISSISVADANAEVRRQNSSWGGGAASNVSQGDRVVLVPPSPESVSSGAGASASPAGDGADAETLAALESEIATLREQLAERERLIDVQSTELADLQNQLAAADNQTATTDAAAAPATATSPGVDIEAAGETEAVFVDESEEPAAVAEPDAQAPAAESEAPAEPAVAEQPEERPTQRVVAPVAAEPTLLERVVAAATSWITLVVAGVAAILLGALWFMRRREEEIEDVTGQWDALEAGMDEAKVPSSKEPATAAGGRRDAVEAALSADDQFIVEERSGASSTTLPIDDAEEIAADHYAQATSEDVSVEDTLSTSQVLNLDEADPVAEADFHMAYGLYDQAAELLSKELQASPERRDLRLKLLEVFFVWGNKDEFLDAATHLREQMGDNPDPDWDKVLIMGKQICPDAELFAAAASGGAPVDVSLSEASSSSLDFAFEDSGEQDDSMDLVDIGEATNVDLAPDTSTSIDLDLTGNQPAAFSETSTGLLDVTGTLNIGSETAAHLEAALFEEPDDDDSRESTTRPLGPNDETVAVQGGLDPESLAATQETPSFDDSAEFAGPLFDDADTESEGLLENDETMLQPSSAQSAGEDAGGGTQELPKVAPSSPGFEPTAEIELNDLGLDVAGIDDDFGIDDIGAELDSDDSDTRKQRGEDDGEDTREQPVIDRSGDTLSATGITQVLAEHLAGADSERNADLGARGGPAGAETERLERPSSSDEFDLDLGELETALSDTDGDTEQSDAESLDFGFANGGGESTSIDLDFGDEYIGSDDPTGTEDMRSADPQTLTEVGTKLDLARAYIDMGDPDGARSILEEVLSEGDTTQRSEAQSLIQTISA